MYRAESKNDDNSQMSTTFQPSSITEISTDPSYEESRERKQKENKITIGSCPPQGKCNKIITDGVTLIVLWILLWSLLGEEVLPGGNLFGLMIIFYSAFLGGKILEVIRIPVVPPLPPLLGMLLAGFTIRNVPAINEFVHIPTEWSSVLRNTALTIILIRAGLGLDPQALKHLKGVCLRLSFGPCLVEACSAAFFSHFLMQFPWQWGFLLGFVLGAVSPAVVVPSMLWLQENGYGVEKGIPTLLVAASSMDDIVAITGFNTFLSIVFSSGCHHFDLHGSGGLVTLVLSFMAAKKWAKEKVGVQKIVANTWNIFQPLLFGLVGTEVSVEALESKTIGESIYCFIMDPQSYSPGSESLKRQEEAIRCSLRCRRDPRTFEMLGLWDISQRQRQFYGGCETLEWSQPEPIGQAMCIVAVRPPKLFRSKRS